MEYNFLYLFRPNQQKIDEEKENCVKNVLYWL